jgi:hypothetical protein
LAAGTDNCLSGRTQQFVLGDQTQGPRLPYQGVSDRHALLCRRQTRNPLLCRTTYYSLQTSRNQVKCVKYKANTHIFLLKLCPRFNSGSCHHILRNRQAAFVNHT